MLYMLLGRDAADSLERRRAARPAHLARLKDLLEAGRIVVGGPLPAIDSPDPGPAGFTGSLIIAEFASQAEAEAWLAADPYVLEGVFQSHEVRPFLKVLP